MITIEEFQKARDAFPNFNLRSGCYGDKDGGCAITLFSLYKNNGELPLAEVNIRKIIARITGLEENYLSDFIMGFDAVPWVRPTPAFLDGHAIRNKFYKYSQLSLAQRNYLCEHGEGANS